MAPGKQADTTSGAAAKSRSSFAGRLLRLAFGPRTSWYFTIPALVIVLLIGALTTLVLDRRIADSLETAALGETQRDAEWEASMLAAYLAKNGVGLPATAEQYPGLDHEVRHHVKHPGIVRVKIWSAGGQILYSDDPALVGETFPVEDELSRALAGQSSASISDLSRQENAVDPPSGRSIEIYAPLRSEDTGRVEAVLEVYGDYGPVAARIDETRLAIYLAVAVALAAIYAVLYVIHRIGARIMGRQRDELLKKSTDLERSYDETLTALARALDQRDHATQDHGRRVSDLACLLTREMGLPEDEVNYIARAAVIHDIGKMTLPDAVLLKPGPLTGEEWGQMRRHPQLGYEMLKDIPVLNGTAGIVYAHHEAYDGRGYPRGLRGDERSPSARASSRLSTRTTR